MRTEGRGTGAGYLQVSDEGCPSSRRVKLQIITERLKIRKEKMEKGREGGKEGGTLLPSLHS